MIALIACLAGSFAACGKTSGKEPEGKSYTITFDVNGGASLSDKTWTEGTTLSLPTPSAGSSIDMYGYTFTGWFYDEDRTLAVDRTNFDVSYAAKGVITLYAGWTNLHSIYFDSKTSETIAPVQFAYGSVVSLSDLPVPSARTVGSTTCDFLYWIRTNTGNPVTEDFVMDAQDMYFHAVYDVGTNTRFELNNEGYYVPTSSESKTTHSRFRNYTLQDGQVYSVDMTLPENWTSYSDDCGPVFTGIHFDEAGTTFNNGHYIVMFISCQKNYNGAIEFWGTADVNGAPKDSQMIARYLLDGPVLSGTPYYEKMTAYQESSEEATFTLTYRRVDNEDNSITWYIGIDGVEYIRLTTGQKPYPVADAGNLTVSTALAAEDDDGNIGSLVGLRAKTKNMKYSNITLTENDGVEIFFDAGNGTLEGEATRTFAYGTPIELPTPRYDGYVFTGWHYVTDYKTGNTEELLAGTTYDSSVWKIFVTAQWRKEGALPFTVRFDTGAQDYTVDDLTGWYEGNRLAAPSLGYYMDSSYLYIYNGNWYYDANCTQLANLNDLDPAKANVTGAGTEGQIFTLYAGSEKIAVLTGEGTEESPYLIASESDLIVMRTIVSCGYSLEGKYIRLTENIALTEAWTPVGSSNAPFSGNFDGNGKTVTGLAVTFEGTTGYAAMFGYTNNATVKNLDLTVNITAGGTFVGGLIAYAKGTTLVENCIVRGSVSGRDSTGAIIGSCYNSTTVRGCVNYATVSGSNTGGASCIGGIIGGTTNPVTIENCTNYGNVLSAGGIVGGIAGILRADANAVIRNCYNYANVSGTVSVGGIAGVNRGTIESSFCYTEAQIGGTAASSLEQVGYRTATASSGPNGYIVGQLDSKAAPTTAKEPVSCGLCDENGKFAYTLDYGYEQDGAPYTESKTGEVGDPLPADLQRAGYRFDGWYLGTEKKTAVCGVGTYTARWIEQITVTFATATGETVTGDTSFTIDVGTALSSLPEIAKTVDGISYTFLGWYTAEGDKVTAETLFAASVTLSARWVEKVTVSLNADGGECETASVIVDRDAPVGTLPVPTKANYNFLGWYTAEGTKVNAETAFSQDAEVTARWEEITQYVDVTFNPNEGTFTDPQETGARSVESGTALGALPAVTRAGYAFKGWYYDAASGDRTAAEESTIVTSTLEVYAVWAELFTVTFDAGAGSLGSSETTRIVEDGSAVGTLPVPVREGYTYVWQAEDGTEVTEETLIRGNTTITAVWTVSRLVGEGTQENPYRISAAEHLNFLAASVNAGEATYNASGVYVAITANIDMAGIAFTPIGTEAYPFAGILSGGGHTVDNLTITGTTYVGFFGWLSNATVTDLELHVTVTAEKGVVGGLAGQISGGTTVTNCTVRGSVQGGGSDVGGIAGDSKSGEALAVAITNCVNYATVTCTISGTACTGGILGACEATYGTVITGCVNRGNVTSGGNFCGGIIGLFRKNAESKVTGCYNYGNVTGGTSSTGGLVGCGRAVVENSLCYHAALINGSAASTLNADGYDNSVSGAAANVGYIIGQIDGKGGGTPSSNCGLCTQSGETQAVITFVYADGATENVEKTASVGGKIGADFPEDPVRTGFVFKGWKDAEGNAVTSDTVFFENATVTADWTEAGAQVTITLNAGKGTLDGENTILHAAGDPVGTLPTPTIAAFNKKFDGWYLGETLVTAESQIAEDVTLVAKYSVTVLLGEGTEANPYTVSDGDELAFFAASVNAGEATYNASGVYVTLTENIDMTGIAFTSVANVAENLYKGVFDGGNKTISGLTTSLFGYAGGATVKNVIVDVNISSTSANTAALIRVAQTTAVTVENCETRGSVSCSASIVAGIVGWANTQLTVTNCINRAAISGTGFTGGIVGSHNTGILTVSGCKNYGTVSSTGTFVGGIIGIARVAAGSTITNCYNFGNVTGKSPVGGIAGCLRVSSTNCYVSTAATITGGADTATIAGQVNNGGAYTNCGTCDENGENPVLVEDKAS